jgi:hypothetical protein
LILKESEISETEAQYNRKYNPVTVLNLISDRHTSKILICTYKSPRSILSISEENDIPIAVCYRKVRLLEKLGFLKCVGKKSKKSGKVSKLYQSQITHAHFFLEKGTFRARIQLAEGLVDDLGGGWSLVDEIPLKSP